MPAYTQIETWDESNTSEISTTHLPPHWRPHFEQRPFSRPPVLQIVSELRHLTPERALFCRPVERCFLAHCQAVRATRRTLHMSVHYLMELREKRKLGCDSRHCHAYQQKFPIPIDRSPFSSHGLLQGSDMTDY
jgi:hypothetical protein